MAISSSVQNFTFCIAGDIHYHPDCWGNPTLGYEYYAQDLGVSVVRATNEVFFDKMVVKSYMSQLQHGWLSAIAKAESYNEPFVKLKNSVKMLNFSLLKNFSLYFLVITKKFLATSYNLIAQSTQITRSIKN